MKRMNHEERTDYRLAAIITPVRAYFPMRDPVSAVILWRDREAVGKYKPWTWNSWRKQKPRFKDP